MAKRGQSREMELKTPADMNYALVVRMALSGFGMLAGLDVDLIDDLRTVTDECFDCLLHQSLLLEEIHVLATLEEECLRCKFCAVRGDIETDEPPQDEEVTRCILETLVPNLQLHCDEHGVQCIDFSMSI